MKTCLGSLESLKTTALPSVYLNQATIVPTIPVKLVCVLPKVQSKPHGILAVLAS